MPKDTYIPSHLLSLDAVQLGQLVLETESPEQDCHISVTLAISDSQITKTSQTSFSETLQRSDGFSLTGLLTSPVATNHKNNQLTTRVQSASSNTHQLRNPSEVFEDICKSSSTKKWIEKAVGRRKKIHMVVGLHILTDAEVNSGDIQMREQGAPTAIPNLVLGAVTGGPIQPGGIADVHITGGVKEVISQDSRFVTPGERIYAVQYRRVVFKWYSSRKIEKAELEKPNWWKVPMRHV